MRELLGGTEENSVPPMRGHWFALQANQWVFTKRKLKKNELVARPGSRQAETSSHQDAPKLQGPGIPRREAFPEASWPRSLNSDGVVRAFQVFSSQVAAEKPHTSRVSPKFECSSSGTGKCGGQFFGVTAPHSRLINLATFFKKIYFLHDSS